MQPMLDTIWLGEKTAQQANHGCYSKMNQVIQTPPPV